MNGKGLFSGSDGIRTCDYHGDVRWYNASDVLGNSFDQEDEGYDFDVSIATFPDPWLWKLVTRSPQRSSTRNLLR